MNGPEGKAAEVGPNGLREMPTAVALRRIVQNALDATDLGGKDAPSLEDFLVELGLPLYDLRRSVFLEAPMSGTASISTEL